jgi:spheroidene monooxygenase
MSSGPVAVLVLVDAGSRFWAWMRLVRGPRALRGTPGLRFAKVLGSGHEGGFGLKPSASRGGLFCLFDDDVQARAFVDSSPTVAEYRRHAREFCSVLLRPYASRGSWDGVPLPASATPPASGPVAALTRASIRPLRAASFWRMAPAAQRSVEEAPGCRLGVGLGEAPLLRQATFSIWDDAAAMDAYAHHGAHLAAIRASAQGRHFSESMFVRFIPEGLAGDWMGRHHG